MRMALRIAGAAAALIVVVILLGCDRGDTSQRVVLYASADDYVVRPIIAEFEKQSGLTVQFVGDSEAKKTAGLVERLRSEQDRPIADVFWSSEIFMTIALADEGVLEAHQSPATQGLTVTDPLGRWHGFAGRARVIVYSPDRIQAADLPRTWMDLTDEKFRGRIVMADPRFGTTGGHLGAMKWYWSSAPGMGEEAYANWLMKMKANQVRLLPGGNAGVVAAVVAGEADLGLTDTDDVWAAQRQGAKVALVHPRHHPNEAVMAGGTLLIPNTVARVKGGPNSAGAAKLIDFLLSAQVERMLAESDSHNVPLNPLIAMEYPYAVPDPLIVDWAQAAAMRQTAIEEAMSVLGPGS